MYSTFIFILKFCLLYIVTCIRFILVMVVCVSLPQLSVHGLHDDDDM